MSHWCEVCNGITWGASPCAKRSCCGRDYDLDDRAIRCPECDDLVPTRTQIEWAAKADHY